MTDFENGTQGGFERDHIDLEGLDDTSNLYQESDVSQSSSRQILQADANGVVTLPDGVSLNDIVVSGRDLVINLADGSVIIIPEGAVIVPQLVVEGVAIPPATIAALLNDAELNPEAGPDAQTPSSGGNFLADEGAIQDAFDLGDLLPYTELGRAPEEDEEIIPFDDFDPEIVIETPDNPIGVTNAIATVNEAGLPERGEEPEGTQEATDLEATSGTFVIDSPDGISALIINGVEITQPGQTIVTDLGILTITGVNFDTGEVTFDYLLTDNTSGTDTVDTFDALVRDLDGDEGTATLTVIIEDDAPIAVNDVNTIPAGQFGPVEGNVLDNDVPGADDYGAEGPVTGFSNESGSVAPGESLQGEYGVLTLNADGTYTYTRDEGTPGGEQDVFSYEIIDSDGSTATATLTIDIGDAPVTLDLPVEGEGGTSVDEDGLAGPPAGTMSDTDSEFTTGTFTFAAGDGVDRVLINGVEVTAVGQTFAGAHGTLTIDAIEDGAITYTYELTSPTDGDTTSDDFVVRVEDNDDDFAESTLEIAIADDEPEAVDDAAGQTEEDAPVTVDVLANDIEGADGVEASTVELVEGTLSGNGTLVNNGDGTFTYTATPDDESEVTFDYQITDGDGDTSVATVTLTIIPDSPITIAVEGDDDVAEEGLPARGDEPAGSDEASDSEFATGVIAIDAGNDTLASLVINGVDVTNGGEVTTDNGVLTITVENGEYSYSYELTDNTSGDNTSDDFTLEVTDSDGSMDSTTLSIAIVDDIPEATDNANTVSEGGETGGNVLTDDDGDGVDVPGADGYAVGGAVVGIASVNQGTSDSDANGDGDFVLEGQYGTLTLNTDGTYTYVANPNVVNADETDTFTYTVRDGDGDESTAELVITVENVAGSVSDDDAIVNEAGLMDGTGELADNDPNNNSDTSETSAVGQITVTNAIGPFVFILEDSADGAYGSLTLNPDGSYTYTLDTAFDHDPDAPGADTNTANGVESFSYRVEDSNGNIIGSGEIVVSVIDDIPQVDIGLAQGAPMALATQDADTIGNASDSDTVDFSGAFEIVDSLYGADGAGTLVTTYALALQVAEGSPSGLASDGADIFLYQRPDGTIVGSTSNSEPATDDTSVIFTLSVDTGGSVTLTQFAEIDHSDSDTGAPYDGDVEALGSDLVELVATATITDSDGDVVSDEQGLDLGGLVTFADDGPSIEADANEGNAPTLETQDADTEGLASDTDVSTANFGGAFTIANSDFGADGAGTTSWAFSLEVANSDSLLSSGGQAINLFLIGGVVVGSTAANALDVTVANTIFDVAVNGDGEVTLTQYQQIDHDLPGVNDGDFDAQLAVLADGRINLIGEATITDEEGDSASDPVVLDLGGNIAFADDGPVAVADTNALSEDIADVSGNVLTDGTDDDFGADGAVATVPAGGVVGVEAGDDTNTPVSGNLGTAVQGDFGELTLNADGTYTYDLDTSLVQGLDDGESETDTFVYTIEDGDGDTSTVTLTITINGSNDAPVAVADTNWTVEDAVAAITGNVLADVAHNGAPDNVDRGDVADTDVDGEDLSVTTPGTFNGTYGVLTLNADGSYSYRLYTEQEDPTAYATVQALGEGEGPLNDVFNYTASDGTTSSNVSSLTISVFGTNDAPTAVAGVAAVSDEGLADSNPDNAGTPTDTTNSSVFLTGDLQIDDTDANDTLDVTLGIPSETISIIDGGSGTALTWAVIDGGNTLIGYVSDQNDPSIIVAASDDGTYTVEILDPIFHDQVGVEDVESFVVPVTVSDGTTSTPTTISVSLEDDSPVLTAPIADQSTSNDPSDPVVVGDLNFAAGADGPAATATITVDTTGLTIGGQPLTTVQVGNVLTAFVDADNSGTFNAGDTAAFKITVDPTAGTSGEYEFDLINPLDGETTLIDLLSDGAFGVGPSLSVLVTQDSTGDELVFVTGWEPNGNGGEFTGGELTDWLNGNIPDLTQVPGVNGSTAGFGVDNNNFDQGEFLRFDFGPLDDYDGAGGFNPPGGTNLLNATFATFAITNFGNGDITHFVAHYSDGTTEEFTFTGSGGGNGSATLDITAPPGTTIAWVDAYQEDGSVKLNLSDLGVTDTNVDIDIPVTIELTDQDGDPVSDSFIINLGDDVPLAQDDLFEAASQDLDLNVSFVLDFSSSINTSELNTQLTAVAEASEALFNSTGGNVSITLVGFDEDALTFGTFDTLANVQALLNSINPSAGGVRPLDFGTSYSEALIELTNSWDPTAGDVNQMFFISDGRPSRDRGPNGEALNNSAQTAWEQFVADNNFEITAIGVGDRIRPENLQAVDIDGNGSPILIENFSDLIDGLVTVVTPPISGNVLDNDVASSSGLSIVSITVDGAAFSFDGSDVTPPGGGSIAGSVFTATTAMGGEFTFDFANGDWTYVPPQGVSGAMENFQYTVADGDGDTDTAILRIDLTGSSSGGSAVPPVVLDLDGDGNAFSSLSQGIAFDYNGDGVKTQTAWIAAGSAILAYDLNGDGLVTDASEFVFGSDDLTDLEAIAANYDENGDNVLDASDSAYGKFGVWIDADLDGVSDEGEFVSLADAGITSIELVSDGIQEIAADGDVQIFGTASFTRADGTTGEVSDAAFALGNDVDPAMMEALLSLETVSDAQPDLADASGLPDAQNLTDVVAILEDVMAEGAVDAMLETLGVGAGDNLATQLASSSHNEAALTQTVDGSAFAMDTMQMADMSAEAAAVAASVG